METETASTKEIQIQSQQQRVASFIENMRAVKFAGARGRVLDSYFLLTYNQATKKDEIDFLSWSEDESRSFPSKFIDTFRKLELPKGKNHPPYRKKHTIPNERRNVPVIAFGMGPDDRAFLFRLKDMSTKISFERLKIAVGL